MTKPESDIYSSRQLPSEPDLNLSAFEQMLDMKNLTNSYKLYWFAAVFDEIIRGNHEITFKRLVHRMIARCWYSLLVYRLNLGFSDQLSDLVHSIKNNDSTLDPAISENDLILYLEGLTDAKIQKQISDLYRYVPFRLISVYFNDLLVGKQDGERNKIIERYSHKDKSSLYAVYSKEEKIIVNPMWFNYIYKNQTIIRGWLYYKLVFFLQKRNPNIPAIPLKLHAPVNRDLGPARKFWNNILRLVPAHDIYSEELLKPESFSVDHYIPWSFVLHDRLWNLVPTTRESNSSKNDRLPSMDHCFEPFSRLQYSAYELAIKKNIGRKLLEDFHDLNIYREEKILPYSLFKQQLYETIMPLFQMAKNSGFPLWTKYGLSENTTSLAAEEEGIYS